MDFFERQTHFIPPRVSPQRPVQSGRVMTENLPLAQPAPVRLAPVRVRHFPVAEPGLVKPVSASDVPLRIGGLEYDYDDTGDDNRGDGDELGDDEEVVQAGASLGANGIRDANDDQDEDGEQLMFDPPRLVGHAHGGIYALNEYDAEDSKCSRHHSYDPRPCSQEAEDVAEDVLEIRLHTTYDTNKSLYLIYRGCYMSLTHPRRELLFPAQP